MHVGILGAGVIGITTAYYLQKAGCKVSVFDRAPSNGQETSYANGGQLSYSHAAPWADPSVIPKIIRWFGKDDAPLVFRLLPDPNLWKWGFDFLRNCTNKKNQVGTAQTLRLSLYSRAVLHDLVASEAINFDYKKQGILHIYDSEDEYKQGLKQAQFQETLGCPFEEMSAQDCKEREPILEQAPYDDMRGILFPYDEVGDIFKFTQELAKLCEAMGVTFHYNTTINRFVTEQNTIRAIDTSKGMVECDSYILALGSHSKLLANSCGLKLPIYPLKGYTLSAHFPPNESIPLPNNSITDQAYKIVYTRLGNSLRVAGTAEVAGYNTMLTPKRLMVLRDQTKRMFPEYETLFNEGKIEEWACLRSSTPDGIPLLGKTPISNLLLNTGHGSLGWTLALGSSKLVSDLLLGNRLEIPLEGLTMNRL